MMELWKRSTPTKTFRECIAQTAHDLEPSVRARFNVDTERVESRSPDSGSLGHSPDEARLKLRFGKHAADIVLVESGTQFGEPFCARRAT